ncbi:MAG: N-6 DNA methylase [Melioribacteraceae bacterium]|nr:N-6 DNA methylase [Melioribacteraceae bacterium]
MNERKTEEIVRRYFEKLGFKSNSLLLIEEQQSDNTIIKKLLKNASKKGNGVGYPEFFIRSKIYSNFLIIVECKADAKKHQSKTLDKFSEYAVDGVLLYASFLAKEFDVLAIAVSGQKLKELKISHYIMLKGTDKPINVFSNEFLTFENYLNSYINHPSKFNQEFQKLLDYSSELNELLHAKKIKESQRSLLISGVLIALQNPAFSSSYLKHKNATQLSKALVDTITNELTSEHLPEGKIFNLKQAYSFIQTHTTLSRDKEFLESLINDIDKNINQFIRTYKYFDTIGQFYIEFLRYANNDKGLGIVLTPPHITELFTDLAFVNKDCIVFDNCCGTGGFLISSMQKMVLDAKDNDVKIKNIKSSQVVGIEYQDDIYALAISNMIIHGDGKSNIHQGDCFSLTDVIKKQYKPNIGMLNPPYKTKKSDIEELEFVLNNIEVLSPNSLCISIIPISCVLAQKGPGFELKKKLLEKHTLEAVISMPDELFHNSKVSVITVIVVIKAHSPHPTGKKTWFAYWKDDGFVKTKNRGRIDLNNTWKEIKNNWLNTYINRQEINRFSLSKEVTAEDEWCAEAYLETDYSSITKEEFIKYLKKYLGFKMMVEEDEKS